MRHTYVLISSCISGNSEHTIFTECVRQLIFGFFSVNNDGAKHHMTDPSDQLANFFHGTKKEVYSFLIEKFSMPGSIVLDMTGCQGNYIMYACVIKLCVNYNIQYPARYNDTRSHVLHYKRLIVLCVIIMPFPLTISPLQC